MHHLIFAFPLKLRIAMSVFDLSVSLVRCEEVFSSEIFDSCGLATIQDLPFKLKKMIVVNWF